MKTLYLHIGQHKTGSTSIQKVLFNNREKLANENFSFFTVDQKNEIIQSGNSNCWVSLNRENIKSFGYINSPKELAFNLAQLPHNVIMSAENLSWIFHKEPLIEFKEELSKYFDKIIIIVYIRRQDKQIISHYQESSKQYMKPASVLYGSEPQAIPNYNEKHRLYLDYNQRISIWGDAFGDDNMVIRVFDKKSLYQGDAVLDFLNLLGIKNISSSMHKNVSMGFEKTKLNHIFNSINLNPALRVIIKKNLDNRGKMLPSKEVALDYYLNYKESNKKLNQRFKINELEYIFDDDFSIYSEKPMDRWSEESANQAIKNMLCALNDADIIILHKSSKLGRVYLILKKIQNKIVRLFNRRSEK
ncbi:MAG: hypothetical protein JXQ76_10095 [Campylobacterales bacterium]|nr:hypothetical protein [Campylobacterales bacterium]